METRETTTLKHGAQMPHFMVSTAQGGRVSYSEIWQRKNLVLVLLPAQEQRDANVASYVERLEQQASTLSGDDTRLVITAEPVPGLPQPGVALADRWGDIHLVKAAENVQALPSPEELAGWLQYVRHRCPECEGEAL